MSRARARDADRGHCAGRVDAFMLGCRDERTHGLCDLWVDTWLVHGDRLRSRWQYDGRAYRKIGDGELIPGPRKH